MATRTQTAPETRPMEGAPSARANEASNAWIWWLIVAAAVVFGLIWAFGGDWQNNAVNEAPEAAPNVESPAETTETPAETPVNP